MGNELLRVPDECRLQIDTALVGQDHDGPQAIRQLMAELRFDILDVAHAGVRLDELGQAPTSPMKPSASSCVLQTRPHRLVSSAS